MIMSGPIGNVIGGAYVIAWSSSCDYHFNDQALTSNKLHVLTLISETWNDNLHDLL